MLTLYLFLSLFDNSVSGEVYILNWLLQYQLIGHYPGWKLNVKGWNRLKHVNVIRINVRNSV